MENERESQYEEVISFVLDDTKGAFHMMTDAPTEQVPGVSGGAPRF